MILDALLSKLEASQLVRRSDDTDPAYLFKHTLTQETVYESILLRRRRHVHELVAQVYETTYAAHLPEIADVLAQHYAQAGNDGKTLEYSRMAGDSAARVYASAEAIAHYSTALEASKRLGHSAANTLSELYLKRGRAMEVSNRHAEALANYQEEEMTGKERGDPSLVLAALISQATLRSIATPLFDPEKGQELSDRALALAREMSDRQAEAKILWNLMLLAYFTARAADSVRFGEQSLEIARAMKLEEQLALTLSDISRSYMAVGRVDNALETQTEARDLLRKLGNLPLLADNLTNSAGVHLNRGELDIAFQLVEEALRTALSIGNQWGEVYAEQVLSALHFEKGTFGEAVPMLEHSVQLGEQIGALFAVPSGYAFLSWAFSMLGEPRRALEYARMAVDKGRVLFPPFVPAGYAMLGYASFLSGNTAEAETFVAKSHENLDPRNFDYPQPFFVSIVEAEVALGVGEPARGLVVLDQLIANLRELGVPVFLAEALYTRSRVLPALGRVDESRANLEEARSRAEAIGQRFVLMKALCSLSRLERDSGNETEAQRLRLQARGIVQEIAPKPGTDLRDLFFALPDVIFALEDP